MNLACQLSEAQSLWCLKGNHEWYRASIEQYTLSTTSTYSQDYIVRPVNNFRSIKSPLANGLPLGSLYTLVAMVAVTVKSIEQFPKSGLGVRHDQKGNDLKTNVRKTILIQKAYKAIKNSQERSRSLKTRLLKTLLAFQDIKRKGKFF